MKPKFIIEINSFKTIHKLPNSWTKRDLIKILEQADFDADETNSEADLYDYMSMAFEELEPEEAAIIVLTHAIGNRLNKNQIEDIAHVMLEENLLEEYGDMRLQEDLFKVTSLLYQAYNGVFPQPDAADIVIRINAANHDGEVVLRKIDEPLIARLLAHGMTEHSVLHRLFHEQIIVREWEEAKDIIWQYTSEIVSPKVVEIELTTAIYWVKELKHIIDYEVEMKMD